MVLILNTAMYGGNKGKLDCLEGCLFFFFFGLAPAGSSMLQGIQFRDPKTMEAVQSK